MHRDEKELAALAARVMDLEFFSARFGIPVKKLQWGIIISMNEDCTESISPAVFIEGDNLFIDILNDNLLPICNICGCKSTVEVADCLPLEVGEGYHFVSENEEVVILNTEIYRVYHYKVYSDFLAKEARKYE